MPACDQLSGLPGLPRRCVRARVLLMIAGSRRGPKCTTHNGPGTCCDVFSRIGRCGVPCSQRRVGDGDNNRRGRRMRWRVLAIGILGGALVLAACGGGSDSSAARPSSSVSVEQESSTTTTAAAVFVPVISGGYTARRVDTGDVETVTLAFGAPMPADSATAPPGWDSLPGACPVDQQRDLVVPFEMTATNGNASLNQVVGDVITLTPVNKAGAQDKSGLDVKGPYPIMSLAVRGDCTSLTSVTGGPVGTIARTSGSAVAPGAGFTIRAWLVLGNTRSPASPNGNLTALNNFVIYISDTNGQPSRLGKYAITTTGGPWYTLPNRGPGDELSTRWAINLAPLAASLAG
jgi:hypothetical protein